MRLAAAVRRLAWLWPPSVEASDKLTRALRTLEVDLAPSTVVSAGYGAGVVIAVGGLPVLVLAPGVVPVLVLGATALATVHAVHEVPTLLARVRRTRAAGEASALVGRATLRMRTTPSVEAALVFAARGDGPLARSLSYHIRRTRGTPATGAEAFAEEWEPWSPPLARAVRAIETAAALPPSDRKLTLERARRTVLEGQRDHAADAAAALQVPVTGVYALGVFLPLALVGILPAASAAGARVPPWLLVVGFDIILPAGLIVAGLRLLARRPSAFPPPAVTRNHPAVVTRRWRVAVAATAGAAAAGLVGWVVLPSWTVLPGAVGIGTGMLLVGWFRAHGPVRARVRAVESDLPDALAFVGRRVGEGTAVETALEEVAGRVGEETGELFADVDRRQRSLGVGLEPALFGPHGGLSRLPSRRLRDAGRLLVVAARVGRPAGAALVAQADHLADLREVERESRRDLRRVTSTLSQTATVFGPLVAGATVALFDGIGGGVGTPLGTATVGITLGGYVLALAAILATLSTGLERGLDLPLVGVHAGRALLAATPTYLLAFTVGRLLT